VKSLRLTMPLSVGHNSPEGQPHGHDYNVSLWFRFGPDARLLRKQVRAVLDTLDHTFLPDDLAQAENLADYFYKQLPGCLRVECDRPLLGICGISGDPV
jgi:6-pyruvoyl-tetrahydropterin synthase